MFVRSVAAQICWLSNAARALSKTAPAAPARRRTRAATRVKMSVGNLWGFGAARAIELRVRGMVTC